MQEIIGYMRGVHHSHGVIVLSQTESEVLEELLDDHDEGLIRELELRLDEIEDFSGGLVCRAQQS